MRDYFIVSIAVFTLLCLPCAAAGQTPVPDASSQRTEIENLRKDFEQLRKRYETEIRQLQDKVRQLSNELEEQQAAGEAASGPPVAEIYGGVSQPPYGASSASGSAWQSFNPDIAVIGDMLAQDFSHEDESESEVNGFNFRELEIGFAGNLDPFARADAIVAIGKEPSSDFEIDIEEAYLTMLTLPYGLQARVGKIREPFGETNAVHLHALPWVDYPLVIKDFFGDEGLTGEGIEVSWLAPTSHYLELAYDVFSTSSRLAGEDTTEVAQLAHAKNLFSLSDSATIELGGSLATAPVENESDSRIWMEGADLTFKWRPPQESLYRTLVWQTEALFAQNDSDDDQQDSWGLYSSLQYQFARNWRASVRYDYSDLPEFEDGHEHGISAYLTFDQSEYVFWRLGYMFVHNNLPDPADEDQHIIMLQCDFALGPHRPHAY